MKKEQPWFVEERAAAFVCLSLTNRDRVRIVNRASRDMCIDLYAEILRRGKPSGQYFGGQIIAPLEPEPIERSESRVMSHLGRDPFDAELPICAFTVHWREPSGWFRWVNQPTLVDGHAALIRDAKAEWHRIDDDQIDQLIDEVTAWYDRRIEIDSSAHVASNGKTPRISTRLLPLTETPPLAHQ